MANQGNIARKYARALLNSLSPESYDEVRGTLSTLDKIVQDSMSLRQTLHDPSIPLAEKKLVFEDILASMKCTIVPVQNFVAILLENKRIDYLSEIVAEISTIIAKIRKETVLAVTSANSLDTKERSALEKAAKKDLGDLVSITWDEDSSLIGGLTIRVGDNVLDGSVRGSLERARQTLLR